MSESPTITGKIHVIYDTQQVSDKFSKREFVVEYADNPQYPQLIKFELTQDKCSMIDAFKKGQEVTVTYNLRGREWTNKQGVTSYFNTVQAWRIEAVAAQQPGNTGQPTPESWDVVHDTPVSKPDEDFDTLPF